MEPNQENIQENLNETSRTPRDYFLGISILIAAVVIGGAIIYSVGKSSPQTGELAGNSGKNPSKTGVPEINSDDVILGDKNAPVTLFEYGDYQCPFCGRFFQQSEPKIRENYIKTGKVKMVYRDFAVLGPESVAAAEAARCAKDQAKFWEYHDALYVAEGKDGTEHNGNLNRDLFLKLAGELSLNVAQFTSCVDSKKYSDLVVKQRDGAGLYGVNSTPSLFINGTPIVGAQPYEMFAKVIDAEFFKVKK